MILNSDMKTIKLALFAAILGLLAGCGPSTLDKERLGGINVGDSLFMKSPADLRSFLRLGHVTKVPIMSQDELRRLNYARKDTMGFKSDLLDSKNAEECFYKSGSTFVGLCVGKDSAQTEYGTEYFVNISPSECLKALVDRSSELTQQKTYHALVEDLYKVNQLKKK